MSTRSVDCVFLNGTVGVGKSTVADAMSELEGMPHAVIDLDGIRRLVPAPAADPFKLTLELANLRALVTNYRAAGARRFFVAGVIERPGDVGRYRDALGASGLLVVRLTAAPDVITQRLRQRHRDDAAGLQWHLSRASVLSDILDEVRTEDLLLESTTRTPSELAVEIRRHAGWEPDPDSL